MSLFKKSWLIGRFRGVEIRLHSSMLLITPFMAYLFRPTGRWDWIVSILVMLGLLASVLLHELGHTLVGQRFGVIVKQIILWPLGGFTQLDRAPTKPIQKLLISLAGPLVNIFLAGLLGVFWKWALPLLLQHFSDSIWAYLTYQVFFSLTLMNLFLAVFNLLPIYPLDGGDILNALIERLFGRSIANTVSIVIGIPFLLGLVVLGFYIHDFILLAFCILIAFSLATLNPTSRRWITLGINYLFKRTGFHHLTEDHDAALRGHNLGLEKNPNDISHLLGRAIAYLNLGQNDLALKDIESILLLDPNHVVALEFRGEMHALKKEYDSALEYYARVKAIKPDWSIPYFDCGSVLLDRDQTGQALAELNRAIELQTQHPIFYLVRSIAQYRSHDLEAAHRDQAEAIRLSAQSALVMSEVNLSLYKDCLDWAKDYYGWVLAKYPRQWLAYQGRADAYAANGQYDAAIPDYDRALALAPKEALIYLHRGLAYKKLGNTERAASDFHLLLDLTGKSHLRRQAEGLLAELAASPLPINEPV